MSYLQEQPDTLESVLETWRPVVGYEDKYEVSDLGRVKSLNYNHTKLPVVLKSSFSKPGYYRVTFRKKGKILTHWVHHLVMDAFVGPRPEGMDINHKDGNKANNALENLEYCTRSRNIQHAFDTGLKSGMAGAKNSQAKISEDDVREIRRLHKAGVLCKTIAPCYGLHPNNIYGIAVGDTWRHII